MSKIIENIADSAIENNENHIISERRAKLNNIRLQSNAYPNDFIPSISADKIYQLYNTHSNEDLENIDNDKKTISIAGRLMLKRIMGKGAFATICDNNVNIQIYVNLAVVGDELYESFKTLDLGDIVGVCGILFRTKTNELTIKINTFCLIAKNIYPLPEKFHGLTNQEQCYRQRYLDLIMNSETKNIFIKRSKIINHIRTFLINEDYLEVETPMMHTIVGGANAKPFITHHNALDMDLFLRIAPELYLKRLIVGGFSRVFEINRNFRNEGLSTRHNPEFTMLEFYESYANYQRMMQITEAIIKSVTHYILGGVIVKYQNIDIDFNAPFAKFTMLQAILHYNEHYTNELLHNQDYVIQELKKLDQKLKAEYLASQSLVMLHLILFELTTEEKLWQPTYIIDYPVDISPLARQSDSDPTITERFELFIAGRELANGYSELNDPEEQALRFKKQVMQKDSGNEEAMHYDADYIRALEYGMPHTGGCGIGIDRLIMLITDSPTIKDVILFPYMRLQAN